MAGWLAGALQENARNVTGMGKAIIEAGKSGGPVAVLVALWAGGRREARPPVREPRIGLVQVRRNPCSAALC